MKFFIFHADRKTFMSSTVSIKLGKIPFSGDNWQCLESFLVAVTEVKGYYWHSLDRTQICCILQCIIQLLQDKITQPKVSIVLYRQTLGQKKQEKKKGILINMRKRQKQEITDATYKCTLLWDQGGLWKLSLSAENMSLHFYKYSTSLGQQDTIGSSSWQPSKDFPS